MGIEKKNYSFRFHEDMVERLRAQAQLENRSLSNLVETILLQYLSTLEEKTTRPSVHRQAVMFLFYRVNTWPVYSP